MTRAELESVLWREGLTSPQVETVLTAADSYALAQARSAIRALGPDGKTVVLVTHDPPF